MRVLMGEGGGRGSQYLLPPPPFNISPTPSQVRYKVRVEVGRDIGDIEAPPSPTS